MQLSLLSHIRVDSFLSTPTPFTLGSKLVMLTMFKPFLQGVDSIACFSYLKNFLHEAFFLVLKVKKPIIHGLTLTKVDSSGGRQACKEIINNNTTIKYNIRILEVLWEHRGGSHYVCLE